MEIHHPARFDRFHSYCVLKRILGVRFSSWESRAGTMDPADTTIMKSVWPVVVAGGWLFAQVKEVRPSDAARRGGVSKQSTCTYSSAFWLRVMPVLWIRVEP